MGVLASASQLFDIEVDIDVRGDTNAFQQLTLAIELGYQGQVDIDGCLALFADMSSVVKREVLIAYQSAQATPSALAY